MAGVGAPIDYSHPTGAAGPAVSARAPGFGHAEGWDSRIGAQAPRSAGPAMAAVTA
ncbi:hypothetical protein NJB1728e18_00030 [Mycobacterium marinum]|nr:hypothetical protein NJB1728e18_00030 [Mycobacterium marinum]GJO74013.1 hypothetical protein NJB1907E49_05480 [Mycobacterium marinum]GJP03307.1 hypothetical protein NJB18001_23340 [Mycobacterium marinum]